jgi:hypothetical protein
MVIHNYISTPTFGIPAVRGIKKEAVPGGEPASFS